MPTPFGAQNGSAGFTDSSLSSDPFSSEPEAALFFDPATRNLRMDPSGKFFTTNPVDQEVVLALVIGLGTIGSSPESGSTLRQILKRQGGQGFVGQIEDAVRLALKKIVDRGDILITNVSIDARVRGRTYIAVSYVNNTRSKPDVVTTPTLPLAA